MSRRRNRLMQSQLQQQQQFVSTQRRRSMIRSEMMSPGLVVNGRNATMATQALRSRRISTSVYNSSQQQFQPVRKNVTSVPDNQFTQRQYALRSYGNLQSYGTTRSQQLRQPQTWRSPRLAAAAAAAAATTNSASGQMQNSMINQQDYFYGAASPQGSLTSPTTSPPRASTGAWGQATRQQQQQQLAVLNNPRWRHSQSVSTESAEATAAAPPPPPPPPGAANEQQKLQLSPSLRKANLCAGRNSMGRRMTMASNQAIDNTNLMIKSSLSVPNFDPLLARDSSEAFDFSLSPSADRRHDEFPDSCSRLRSRKTTSRANAYEMESKENGTNMLSLAISAGYLTPEEFMYFNEPFESTWKNVKLTLLQQPELQHRARYLTEGSRGPIKNRNFDGYPTIQLEGWSGPALVQVFVANEASDPHLHMFYQVCLVSTKSNRGCSELVYGFTTVVQAPFTPNSEDRVMSIDSVGLVKLRNSDVERRMASLSEEQQKKLLRASGTPSSSLSTVTSTAPTTGQPQRSRQSPVTLQTPSVQTCEDAARRSIKPKSSSARLVYRVLLLSSVNRVEGVLQVISDPIRCTQIVGGPEISRMSIREAHVRSQPELFIIGKNFVRGTRVIFKQLASPSAANVGSPSDVSREDKIDVVWEKEAGIDANYFYQTHLICKVPEYNGPSCPLMTPLQVHVYIQTPTKIGRPEIFTYLPSIPIYGPPTISRLSLREAPSRGMVDLFILGNNFSNDCRVVFRQVVMATDNSHDDAYTPPRVFEEAKVVWQREAQVEAGLVNKSHLVCRVPPYDGQSLPLLNPLLVQVVIEGSNGTTSPENFYYIQCEG
uniref:RHD domain-containing protein n=1 Tax=Mesocestoides corti TaxID=53468 RepID=A0A5K3FI27_MESCO